MECITFGLPISAKEYLSKAFTEAFGEGMVEISEINPTQLRSRVRVSARNVADVLVVLDGVSSEKCADIENGLYSSDKYHEYFSDEDLVAFLNEKYDLNLEVKSSGTMELSVEGSAEQDMIIEKLREQVGDRDAVIASLRAQISELRDQIDDEGIPAEVDDGKIAALSAQIESLTNENLKSRSEISDLEARAVKAETAEASVRTLLGTMSGDFEKFKTEHNQLLADYRAVSTELGDYKVRFSNAQGALNAKDREIEELRRDAGSSAENEERIKNYEERVKSANSARVSAEEEAERLRVENSQYELELKSKEDEIVRLSAQGTSEANELEEELSEERVKVTDLQKELVSLQSRLATAEESASSARVDASGEVSRLESENALLREKLQSSNDKLAVCDEQLMQLNSELIKVKSTAEMLEKSTNRDTDIESMYQENNEIRNQYTELSQSVFGRLASYSSPNSSAMIDLIKSGDRYEHIRFVFSGSTESRKGTYRSLLDEFKGIPDEQIVIVDATCETCVDYVFEIKQVVKGLNWFIKGGGIMPYLSETCLPNVKVLSPGLGYINDCYFLTVDWESRLKELDKSGYNVVVYCGDISSIVGRVLHETFAARGSSMIYVHGNAIGARTLVTNLRGLSNSKDSIMCYFEFNKKVEKFFEVVRKEGHDCRVISMV